MFIPIFLNLNPNTQNEKVVLKNSYNPVYDKNIIGYTTKNGNWILKDGTFVTDFLSKKINIYPKIKTKTVKYDELAGFDYTYPGDVPYNRYEEREKQVNYTDTEVDIPGNFFALGGSDTAEYNVSVKIPWDDIKSWISANNLDVKTAKIKKVYFIPEITLTNPPINSMNIKYSDIKINNNGFGDKIQAPQVPYEMQNSYWTISDVLDIYLKFVQYTSQIASLVPITSLPASAIGSATGIASEILNSLKTKSSNYVLTRNNANRVAVASDVPIKEGEDLRITSSVWFYGWREYGYFADKTQAHLSNVFVVMEI